MVPVIFVVLLLVGLGIATYRDVQVREVPDLVSYGLIIIGLLGGLIIGLVQQQLSPFLEHLYGFLIGLVIGMLMYYTRQWGGGDAKLLAGVGAVLGFSMQNLSFAEFLVLLVFCGALYGVVTILYMALIRHRTKFLPEFRKHIRTPVVHRIRIALVVVGLLVVVALFFVSTPVRIVLGFVLLGLYLLTYSWIFMGVVESSLLIKEYPVSKLTEGDWVIKDVSAGKRLLVSSKTTGITKEQIQLLKRHKVKSVTVKEGIPFVPGFLIAALVLLGVEFFLGPNGLVVFLLGL